MAETIRTAEVAFGECVIIWRVYGIEDIFFATKGDAERAARARFPNEESMKRYGRISCLVSQPRGNPF